MWQRLTFMLAVIAFLGAAYLLWAYSRITWVSHWPLDWGQPFPYPDRWLTCLNDYYDRLYPSPPGFIKLEGELQRVRDTLQQGIGGLLTLSAICAVPTFLRWCKSRRKQGPGFPVLPIRRRDQEK